MNRRIRLYETMVALSGMFAGSIANPHNGFTLPPPNYYGEDPGCPKCNCSSRVRSSSQKSVTRVCKSCGHRWTT